MTFARSCILLVSKAVTIIFLNRLAVGILVLPYSYSFIYLKSEKGKLIQFVEPTRLYPGALGSEATAEHTPLQSHVMLVLSYQTL